MEKDRKESFFVPGSVPALELRGCAGFGVGVVVLVLSSGLLTNCLYRHIRFDHSPAFFRPPNCVMPKGKLCLCSAPKKAGIRHVNATLMVPHCSLGARGPIEVVSRRQRGPKEEEPRSGSNSSHYNPAFITPFSSLRHTRKYISGEKKLFFTPVCEARHNRLRNPSHI